MVDCYCSTVFTGYQLGHSLGNCSVLTYRCLLNQAHAAFAHTPGFLKLLWLAHRYVCVSLPPRPLITSGMIWCDIDRVWLGKQVLRPFPAFNYFIRLLLSIKWMGVGILSQHMMNACQRKLRWHGNSYKNTTQKTECFIYKSEWANA